MKTFIRTTAFIVLALPTLLIGEEDLAVIVNKSNATSNLTQAQLKRIVLGEQANWPSGKNVSVILRSPGQPERAGVLRSVAGMSEDDFNQHLLHAHFNGDTSAPPKALSSAVAVRALVTSIPGAIGFVRVSDVNDSVKVVSVDGVAAGAAGYKIKEGK